MLNLAAAAILQKTFSASKCLFLRPVLQPAPLVVPERFSGTFFGHKTAKDLWKSVTTVSSQGRKRGRARGVLKIKNLHVGQKLGFGPARMLFPGLNTLPLDDEKKRQAIGKMKEDTYTKYEESLKEIRALSGTRRGLSKKQSALERGWSGANPQGRKFGPPISKNPDLNFDGFDSILIEYRPTIKMTGTFGRVREIRLLMVTGNRNGTAGFAMTRSKAGRGPHAFQRATNRAGTKLITIDLYEDRTIFHNFFSNFGGTTIIAEQKPKGYGIRAHRLIKAICELYGIKDIQCTLEGRHNYLHICKAFFLGLMRQRTHQMLANEKRLHLVELREENDNFPKLVATPNNGPVRTKEEIGYNEILDFEHIAFDGAMPYVKPPAPFFWERLPSYQIRLRKVAKQVHQKQRRLEMNVDHGIVDSHLSKIFPECVEVQRPIKKKKKKEA